MCYAADLRDIALEGNGAGGDGGGRRLGRLESKRVHAAAAAQNRQPVSRMSNPPGVQRRTTSVSGGRCTGKPRTTAQSRPCNVFININTERAMLLSTRSIQRSCESCRIRFRFSTPNQTLTTLGREQPGPTGDIFARQRTSKAADTGAGFSRWRMATIRIVPEAWLRGKPTIGSNTHRLCRVANE